MESSGQIHAPVALPFRETSSRIDRIGGWKSFRTGLDFFKKKIAPCSCLKENANSVTKGE
jgi:hypothetical protein